ncbi:cytochrome c oxidase subunit I [Candidatus Poriferisocius sp.]|uniref:cytochrome c oxidase subunit I n=1 Tax=Candidatus Poriferisocius sp. TaxID=3101276 RepID=UPI003B02B3C1
MTITDRTVTAPEETLALPAGPAIAHRPLGVFTRPQGSEGWQSWLFTVDHKRIGIMYGAAALFFFLVGGAEALFIRLQLATPNGSVIGAGTYNGVFTMHGVTMVFLVIMPMAAAFANYLLPLQVGARDVAFPRLNAFSFWCFLAGGLLLTSSVLIGGWFQNAPDGGWFAYAPNTGLLFSPSKGIDFYAVGLQILGVASLVSAINLIVTVLNMRTKGMSFFRMPVLTWMLLITQFLLLFALPVITVALFLLMFDRLWDANFFNVEAGADPLLWQHLFWIFGHPEVYILILPAFGIVSEIIPTFSRKPLFGYHFMVASGIAIGFMGWGVWAHHMFTSGVGPLSVAAFSVSTMFIAVPTGVKILNWLATMYRGRLRFTTPMLYAVGVVSMFTIGGLSGVTHAIAPSDTQQTDTYYIVAHFHYVIFGGALLGLFGGFYYWWPKAFGYKLNEVWGKASFWVMLIGFNFTFGPMHILGLQGMSRRIATYRADEGFALWNMVATISSFVIALGVAMFFWNVFVSTRNWRRAGRPDVGPDPWDARGLEWMTASPVPEHNFDSEIEVERLDEFWHRKYGKDESGRIVKASPTSEVAHDGSNTNVHLPSPSYWPIVLGGGILLVGYGIIYNLWLAAAGLVLLVGAIYGWILEPADDPDAAGHHDDHSDDGDDHGDPDSNGGPSGNGDSAEAEGPEDRGGDSAESEEEAATVG